jgi:uncharacterized membrane-anchored protein
MKQWILAGALALGLFAGAAGAQDEAAEPSQEEIDAASAQFLASLQYQQGKVALPGAGATITVGEGFRYLGEKDAQRVLEEWWGNPPDDTVIGMLVPDDAPLGDDHSWGVVVTFNDEGYVSDEDAKDIDYDEMLEDMKAETASANEARKAEGYETVDLVGWARPPTYDSAAKRLHWAKELDFEGSTDHTVNYDIRVLGRKGYLSLNAIANMGDLERVQSGMARVLTMAQFDEGQRYADFNEDTDKVAAYGLAALVAGGVAAKSGLFAKLFAVLLAGKKFVVLIVVGAWFALRKLFGKKDDTGTVS